MSARLAGKGLVSDDLTAGDFLAGISGRLCVKIIWLAMDDECMTKDIPYAKAICLYGKISFPVAGHERRKIPGVFWMRSGGRIIVVAGFGKVFTAAASPFMDMHGEKACFGVSGKSTEPEHDEDTVALLIKLRFSAKIRCVSTAANTGNCIRFL